VIVAGLLVSLFLYVQASEVVMFDWWWVVVVVVVKQVKEECD